MQLTCRGTAVPLENVAVMGVLNVTPDSFSDGGLWLDPDAAIKHGIEMATQGAAIIDVGGESTRPGAEAVTTDEELRRVLPVIEGLVDEIDAPISIDTRKPAVAERAVTAGAAIINDTAGEASERHMDRLAAESGAAIVVMHSRGTPATMRSLTDYGDVVTHVRDFLARRAEELQALGIAGDAFALDPGIGFAKNPEQNMVLLQRLDVITQLEPPILIGTSRKSFIGAALDLPEDQRLEGSIATVVMSVMKGAALVRVHDVEPTVRAVRMTEAILAAGPR
jgi:dihydropteroate synthase